MAFIQRAFRKKLSGTGHDAVCLIGNTSTTDMEAVLHTDPGPAALRSNTGRDATVQCMKMARRLRSAAKLIYKKSENNPEVSPKSWPVVR